MSFLHTTILYTFVCIAFWKQCAWK